MFIPVPHHGALDTGASGFFTYAITGTQLCCTLRTRDLSADAAAAHIHLGPRHVAGPVVIPLTIRTGISFTSSACVTASSTLLADIQAHPEAYHVNVHTPAFPGSMGGSDRLSTQTRDR